MARRRRPTAAFARRSLRPCSSARGACGRRPSHPGNTRCPAGRSSQRHHHRPLVWPAGRGSRLWGRPRRTCRPSLISGSQVQAVEHVDGLNPVVRCAIGNIDFAVLDGCPAVALAKVERPEPWARLEARVPGPSQPTCRHGWDLKQASRRRKEWHSRSVCTGQRWFWTLGFSIAAANTSLSSATSQPVHQLTCCRQAVNIRIERRPCNGCRRFSGTIAVLSVSSVLKLLLFWLRLHRAAAEAVAVLSPLGMLYSYEPRFLLGAS